MGKENRSILEQLYTGDFVPTERIASSDPDYDNLWEKQSSETDYFLKNLNSEDKARFEKLIEIIRRTECMDELANFTFGLRTGIRLMCEVFFTDDTPPIHRN